jgi:hypothetical protein
MESSVAELPASVATPKLCGESESPEPLEALRRPSDASSRSPPRKSAVIELPRSSPRSSRWASLTRSKSGVVGVSTLCWRHSSTLARLSMLTKGARVDGEEGRGAGSLPSHDAYARSSSGRCLRLFVVVWSLVRLKSTVGP